MSRVKIRGNSPEEQLYLDCLIGSIDPNRDYLCDSYHRTHDINNVYVDISMLFKWIEIIENPRPSTFYQDVTRGQTLIEWLTEIKNENMLKNPEHLVDLIPLESAKKLKSMGFNEKCLVLHTFFDKNIVGFEKDSCTSIYVELDDCNNKVTDRDTPIPTYDQVFRWFRKVKGIVTEILCHKRNEFTYVIYDNYGDDHVESSDKVKTWEGARSLLLDRLLELYGN